MADPAFLDDAPPDDLVEVGRVAAAHGVRGWLKIQPYSPQADALLGAPVWWLKAPDPVAGSGALPRPRGLRIRACRRQAGQFLAAQADGIADRDTAESLRGYTVWVPRAAFPSAGDDEYYWIDLIGCDFHGMGDDGPRLLGRVDQVLDNGAHAVLQVALGAPDAEGVFQPFSDARGRPRHVLVPFVAAHVQHVDLQARRIDSDWPADF
ncbi:ribosome maturation factor RimM [Castellaniella defragrans]|nr:ribosome maturation factor RimM [Castellaniella defragrans]KAB0604033.1 ribosome maturation factor RimM [Castellaniella defragrans]MBB6082367.1 16S rRNA processing protein RimM [Castellaniella defragrans]